MPEETPEGTPWPLAKEDFVDRIPLKSLHPESSLSRPKLVAFSKLTTDELIESLRPGKPGALKVRPDGTIMDGHHRVYVLRGRGVDVEALPRELLEGAPPRGYRE